MKRPLKRHEFESVGLEDKQIDDIMSIQDSKANRRFRYMVALTDNEAAQLAKETGHEFIRATKWNNRKHRINLYRKRAQ